MEKQFDHFDSQTSDNCSQWSSQSVKKQNNLFSTLSQNLRKYQRIYKHTCHQVTNQLAISLHSRSKTPKTLHENKENYNLQQYLDVELKQETRHTRKHLQRIRIHPKTSKENREEPNDMQTLKQKELRFQRKDRKKCKDRFVDIFVELKQSKGREKLSLKQIDNINKQNKEQKLELFLKLLKR